RRRHPNSKLADAISRQRPQLRRLLGEHDVRMRDSRLYELSRDWPVSRIVLNPNSTIDNVEVVKDAVNASAALPAALHQFEVVQDWIVDHLGLDGIIRFANPVREFLEYIADGFAISAQLIHRITRRRSGSKRSNRMLTPIITSCPSGSDRIPL